MASNRHKFSTNGDGTVTIGGSSSSGTPGMQTNVVVWAPAIPTAFEKARDANIFTRLGTRHPHEELKAALDTTPEIQQTFCLSVNNVILVFSADQDEHDLHVDKVLQMLQDRGMTADIRDLFLWRF
jgi:hypothetical protein